MFLVTEDGYYVATRKVNPILAELFDLLYKTYGSNVLMKPRDFLHIDDVAVIVRLERLRDDLAANIITKEDFMKEVYKLLEKHANVSSEVYQLLNKLHIALTGQPLTPPRRMSFLSHQIIRIAEERKIELYERPPVEGWGIPETRSEAVLASSNLLTGRERRCPICKSEPYFLRYIGKYYCYNCKIYVE